MPVSSPAVQDDDPGIAAFHAAVAAAGKPPGDPGIAAFRSAVASASKKVDDDPGIAAFHSAVARATGRAAPADESGWDYAGAVLKGVAGVAGIPTSVPKTPSEMLRAGSAFVPNVYGMVQSGADMVKGIHDANDRAKAAAQAGNVPRVLQAAVSGVPLVGGPLAAAAGPAITYSEGRAPTHEENVAAVEGAASLAALAVAPKIIGKLSTAAKARIANIEAARGVAPAETGTPEASMNAQMDKLTATPEEAALAEQAGRAQAEAAPRVSDLESATTQMTAAHRRIANITKAFPPEEAPAVETPSPNVTKSGPLWHRGVGESGGGSEPTDARLGPGEYWSDNKRVAEIFAENRTNGSVVSADIGEHGKVFDATRPELSDAASMDRLSNLLAERYGMTPADIDYFLNHKIGPDAFTNVAREIARKTRGGGMWPGAGIFNAMIREAGFDAIKNDVRDLPDLPNHTELVRLRPPETQQQTESPAAMATEAPPEPTPEVNVDSANPMPSIPNVLKATKKIGPVKEFVDAIAPASASPEAASSADIVREARAKITNDATVERVRNKETAKSFESAGDDRNIESISNFEQTGRFMRGGAFPDQASADAYSKMYQETTDAAHATLKDVYGDDRVGYVENYVRRAFEFGSKTDEARASGVLTNKVASLSANKSVLKGRVLGMPLDEALQTMRDAGIDVKPVTTNPELLRQWTVENANQARVYKQAWEDAKAGKLIQFVKQGARVPDGMVALNDRVAQVFRPTEEGPVKTGSYYAEPGAARIFNNVISKGLGGSPTFRAIRAINNSYNQMQLGLSAFHLTGTAINATISDVALGLQQLIHGDVAGAAKSVGRSPGAFVRDLYNGNAFIKDLVADDPSARQVMAERLNPAGGRLGVDQSYRNAAADNMVKAWSNGRYIRALGNAPLAIVQKIASPLMDFAIPRVKIGAFLDLAGVERQRLGPNASTVDIQRAYERAWDSIDNRFGQLTHDNLFWNRTAADLVQVSTRSVGWNLGTIRELGGGVTDLARGKITPRALYSFSLPLVAGTIGAIYQYLHTGQMPQETKDYFYPKNGLTDNHGNPDRVALPTYMKDVYSYSQHPVLTLEHKASPILSLAVDLGTNRDFFGDMIRNPEETKSKQWMQMGQYALRQARPFSIQQAANTAAEGGPLQAVEQGFGFTKAPGEIRQPQEDTDRFSESRRLKYERAMQRAAEKHGGS